MPKIPSIRHKRALRVTRINRARMRGWAANGWKSGERWSPKAEGAARNARRRLRTGDVLFEKVGVLHAGELDRKAPFDMAHHPARGLAERDQGPDLGRLLG